MHQQGEKNDLANDQLDGELRQLIEKISKMFPPHSSLRDAMDHLLPSCQGATSRVEEVTDTHPASEPSLGQGSEAEIQRIANEICAKLQVANKLDDNVAEKIKAVGNDAYKKTQFRAALKYMTQALLHVQSDTLLATLLNNRSTVFFHIGMIRSALADATMTLKLKPDYTKALSRRAECLKMLGFPEMAKRDEVALQQEEYDDVCGFHEVWAIYEKLAFLEHSSQSVSAVPVCEGVCPGFSIETVSNDPVTLQPQGGKATTRRAVTTQKLKAGDAVINRETPAASVIRFDCLLSACAYCLRPTSCLYPSNQHRSAHVHSRGLFCSENCSSAYWELYGKHEAFNPFFAACPVDTLLAFRLLRGIQRTAIDFSSAGLIDAAGGSNFGDSHLFCLPQCSKELNFPRNPVIIGGYETAATCTAILCGALAPGQAAERLLKFHRIILRNGVDIHYTDRVPTDAAGQQHSLMKINVGKALYGLSSQLSHSCKPNCRLSFVGNPYSCSAQVHVRAIAPIAAGEQLTVAYRGIDRTTNHSTRSRIQQIASFYNEFCTCPACFSEVDEIVPLELKDVYVKAADYFQKGKRLMREGNAEEAVTVLLQSLEIVMTRICPPPRPPQHMLAKTHDALAQAEMLLGHTEKCIEHIKASIAVSEELHGAACVDVAKEYDKMNALYKKLASTGDVSQEKKAQLLNEAQNSASKAVGLLRLHYGPSPELELEECIILGKPTQISS